MVCLAYKRLLFFVGLLLVLSDCQEFDAAPIASFTIENAGCIAPCEVVFTSTSTNSKSYLWDFGDGQTSNEAIPRHIYQEGNSYKVKLTAKGDGGVNGVTQTILVQNRVTTSGPGASPVVAFGVTNDGCTATCSVNFTNQSTNASTYLWEFGDGTTSTLTEPTKEYTKGGEYVVKLTAAGTKIMSTTKTISIKTPNQSVPISDFDISNSGCSAPCLITFTNKSKNSNSYSWDFGDNSTSTDVNPIKEYTKEGTFTVKLVVTGSGGTHSVQKEVTIMAIEGRKYVDLPFATMVFVQGGSFQMGDSRGEGFSEDIPVHEVTVSSFWMGRYEVTQRQWGEIMGTKAGFFEDCNDCPVERISWENVQEFLRKLNIRTGGNYRLPTEAEWEYAAGGGSINRTRFGNGRDIADPSQMNFDASAAYKTSYSVVGEFRQKTLKVGSFQPNTLGLFDMSGNVSEFCQDWYGNYSSASQTNPQGPASGTRRVTRGGFWGMTPRNSRVSSRNGTEPIYNCNCLGFRIVASQ